MPSAPTVPAPYALPARTARGRGRPPRWRQALPWVSLIALVAVLQALLIWLTVRYEHTRIQEQVEQVANAVAADATARVGQDVQRIQALLWNPQGLAQWRTDAADLLRQQQELLRLEWRGPQGKLEAALDSPFQPPLFGYTPRDSVQQEADLACVAAARLQAPALSRSYFVPLTGGRGLEVVDVCVPMDTPGPAGLGRGSVVLATMALGQVLERVASPAVLHRHELSFLEGDGTRLVRAGSVRGSGVYVARRVVDLPGLSITLQVDSAAGSPQLIPNLSTALVLGLSLALFGVMALLVRDVRMRATTERRLAESLALRKAMEDSLTTGLRARDLQGRITYVNPAFCRMVGRTPEDLIGLATPPYWPPELVDTYRQRQIQRLADGGPPREGYETTFMRANGERFPVVIYEAPLVDADGRHTGWMSTALDVSEQRKVEELSRQQHDKLQATARLATVGEMASLLSHELNQPLAAIASYATGSLNLFGPPAPDAPTLGMIHQAIERIAEQAQRAGRVIKSVHNFIRRRELARESLRVDPPLRHRVAAGAHARAQERRPRGHRPAHALPLRAVRPHDDRAGAAEPHPQRPAGHGRGRDPARAPRAHAQRRARPGPAPARGDPRARPGRRHP